MDNGSNRKNTLPDKIYLPSRQTYYFHDTELAPTKN